MIAALIAVLILGGLSIFAVLAIVALIVHEEKNQ